MKRFHPNELLTQKCEAVALQVQGSTQGKNKRKKLDDVKFSTKFSLNKIRLLVNKGLSYKCVVKALSTIR